MIRLTSVLWKCSERASCNWSFDFVCSLSTACTACTGNKAFLRIEPDASASTNCTEVDLTALGLAFDEELPVEDAPPEAADEA